MTVHRIDPDRALEELSGADDSSAAPSSLDDLFADAMLAQAAKNPKQKRAADPSLRNALDAAAKRMRDLYALPENWERTRGVALIDKGTNTLIGNYSEYRHLQFKSTRRLVREHSPISIDATEYVEGYLGSALEERIRGKSWTTAHEKRADLWLDELMVGAPDVLVHVCLHLGSIVRVELAQDTQLASISGGTIISLPAGTNVWEHLSTDTRNWLRKQVSL